MQYRRFKKTCTALALHTVSMHEDSRSRSNVDACSLSLPV
jgi:hypothetical protein